MKIALIMLAGMLAAALPVLAALGDTEASVQADSEHFRTQLRSTAARSYTLHEMTRPDGTVIHEYVSPAGKVFGVTWFSPTMPDLSQLLGSNFSTYESEIHPVGARKGRHTVPLVQTGDLTVESGGHQRSFHGRAYLSSLLPAGVSAANIQ